LRRAAQLLGFADAGIPFDGVQAEVESAGAAVSGDRDCREVKQFDSVESDGCHPDWVWNRRRIALQLKRCRCFTHRIIRHQTKVSRRAKVCLATACLK
jgi:hypothetical protein